jgi:HD-GYP domain-containing protein (c-di-GMP phosphodiesterase class II)
MLGYPTEKLTVVKASALLHDIGKIRVPDSILVKPGPLSDAEWHAMREHPRFGAAILKHIEGLSGCLPTIQHHHERFDGTGYPAGLRSSEIPLDARILAVSDAYDAMTSPRPYRRDKMSHQQATDELTRCAGRHFDPEIVRAFEKMWDPLDSSVTASGVTRLAKRPTVASLKILELLPHAAPTL